jgi:hypothetical protein
MACALNLAIIGVRILKDSPVEDPVTSESEPRH